MPTSFPGLVWECDYRLTCTSTLQQLHAHSHRDIVGICSRVEEGLWNHIRNIHTLKCHKTAEEGKYLGPGWKLVKGSNHGFIQRGEGPGISPSP